MPITKESVKCDSKCVDILETLPYIYKLYHKNVNIARIFGDFPAYECKNPKKPPEGGFLLFVIPFHQSTLRVVPIF